MFTKQNRFAQSSNFNPPPNIYDAPASFSASKLQMNTLSSTQLNKVKNILTGSLKGPSEANNVLGSFGGGRRFEKKDQSQSNLGPGCYTKLEGKQKEMNGRLKKRSKSDLNIGLRRSNHYQQSNQNKPLFIGKFQSKDSMIIPQQPIQQDTKGFSFPKSRYKSRQQTRTYYQQQPQLNVNCLNPEQFQPVIKIKEQNRKRKLQLLEMIVKKQVPKLNALNLQYNKRHEKKVGPGPGAYNLEQSQEREREKQSLLESSAFKSRISKTLFQKKDSLSSLRGPGAYNVGEISKFSGGYCFNRELRKTSLVEEKQLPCQFYQKNQSIVKKSHNKANGHFQAPFGSGQNRFSNIAKQQSNMIQYKAKRSKSRSSTYHRDTEPTPKSSNQPLQSIQILTDFYRNK